MLTVMNTIINSVMNTVMSMCPVTNYALKSVMNQESHLLTTSGLVYFTLGLSGFGHGTWTHACQFLLNRFIGKFNVKIEVGYVIFILLHSFILLIHAQLCININMKGR